VLVRRRLPLALVAVLCLAGCGPPKAGTPGHYTLDPTAECLKKIGLDVAKNPADLDFVTDTAPAGALRSARDGKRFYIAFGNNEADAIILVEGYRRAAPTRHARRRLRSLLDREGNAVIYWQTEPNAAQSTAVRSCLK
jgi:hypothetical protein